MNDSLHLHIQTCKEKGHEKEKKPAHLRIGPRQENRGIYEKNRMNRLPSLNSNKPDNSCNENNCQGSIDGHACRRPSFKGGRQGVPDRSYEQKKPCAF